jgi:hypothetical protein
MRRITALPLAALTLTALAACTTGGAPTVAPAPHSTGPVAKSAQSVTPLATPLTSQTPTRSAGPTEAQTPAATPTSTAAAVHFDTPEAAMRYLASAYNRNDLAALKKVTNPSARDALEAMRAQAVNLRLKSCERQPAGDYECDFRHDYPPGYSPDDGHADEDQHDGGHATFIVAPADNPGWYMTVLLDCG